MCQADSKRLLFARRPIGQLVQGLIVQGPPFECVAMARVHALDPRLAENLPNGHD